MVGYTGDTWTFEEPLTTIAWSAPRPLPAGKDVTIAAALAEDIASTPCCNDDPYFGGKQMAVFARLALIADELGETALAQQARERVRPVLEAWLDGTNGDYLVYETTWGGVCSLNGLNDHNADFGNGMYNDHHFHYGYHIYTAAVIAKMDPEWGTKWDDAVLHMISDVAEPSRVSDSYPFTRTKDWYDGHAWASGIYMFADGKNQESTSESVNGWYAIYLYGLARENTRVQDLGRLMTALEIRAAKEYWQMSSQHSNFPAPFSDNKAVGIQWSTKVDYATWFGGNVEFIHCIQVEACPVTPSPCPDAPLHAHH
jgi:endo-1,3(4)-beta-glucanase